MKLLLAIALLFCLSGCSSHDEQPIEVEAEPVFTGELTDLTGADISYRPYQVSSLEDYTYAGKTFHIIKNPEKYSATGFASSFGTERNGQQTSIGDYINAYDFIGAHATLPLPSYVRVTNLNNGRQLIVLINDRLLSTDDNIIMLSKGVVDNLNATPQSKIKVDYIAVAADGTLSGPGIFGNHVVQNSYALPVPPDLTY